MLINVFNSYISEIIYIGISENVNHKKARELKDRITMMSAMPKGKKNLEKQIMRHMLSTFLLWLINKEATHGYSLIKKMEGEQDAGDRAMKLVSASQLYPLLAQMMDDGLIAQKKVYQGKRIRKIYHITAKGTAALIVAKQKMCRNRLRRQFLREMVN